MESIRRVRRSKLLVCNKIQQTTTYSCKYTIITGKGLNEGSSSTPCKKRLGLHFNRKSTTKYYADFSFPRVRGYGKYTERIERLIQQRLENKLKE